MQIALVALHADCPNNPPETTPPKYEYDGMEEDGLTLHLHCALCHQRIHLTMREVAPPQAHEPPDV